MDSRSAAFWPGASRFLPTALGCREYLFYADLVLDLSLAVFIDCTYICKTRVRLVILTLSTSTCLERSERSRIRLSRLSRAGYPASLMFMRVWFLIEHSSWLLGLVVGYHQHLSDASGRVDYYPTGFLFDLRSFLHRCRSIIRWVIVVNMIEVGRVLCFLVDGGQRTYYLGNLWGAEGTHCAMDWCLRHVTHW